MQHPSDSNARSVDAGIVRIGGIAIFVTLVLHFVLNSVLKEFPPDNPTDAELAAYLAREADTWAIVNGLRYVAFPALAVFSAGLFMRTCVLGSRSGLGWGVVALVGTAMLITNGIVTNGMEALAFMNTGRLSSDQFWLLFEVTRVLFTAEVIAWSLILGGFSVAAHVSRTLPRWHIALGLIVAVAGVVADVFVVSVVNEGWAVYPFLVTAFGGMLWFASAGVMMAIRPIPTSISAP